VYEAAAGDALADLGVDASEDLCAKLGAFVLHEVREGCATLDIDLDEFWALRDRHASRRAHEGLRNGHRGVYDDARTIDALADEVPLGLVSNNRHDTVVFVADHFGFDFEVVRGRDPTVPGFERLKPDPYYLEDAITTFQQRTGLDPRGPDSRALYVGDRETDVQVGDQVGFETAFVRRPHNADVDLSVTPTYELDALDSLASLLERSSVQ
jgi:phosphoglycolate phosphatase-like HAD superfamily hydrolase